MNSPERQQNLDQLRTFPLAEQVSRALEGAVFPLSRELLVAIARENEAPSTLVTLFYGIPRRVYRTLDGVQRAVEEVTPAPAAP